MPKRKPDKREQKRIDKHNREEESRRAKAILAISYGESLRDAGEAAGRSREFARYWRDKAMEKTGYRAVNGKAVAVYSLRKGWKELIRVRRPGPPPGRNVKQDAFRERAIEVKKKHPKIGCAKLVIIGKLDISGPTLCEILKSEGLIEPVKTKRASKRFRAKKPNDMWQIDYLDVGHGHHLLSVIDDCSGKTLSDDIRDTTKTDDVMEIMGVCFSKYGTPKSILSDHGTQWYAVRGGDARFDGMCEDNDIKHIMGRIAHPQTQGKVERYHRSLLYETDMRLIEDPAEKKRVMTEHVEFYNSVRPHWGLKLKTPDSVYYSVNPG